MQNHYQVLGVSENATPEVLRIAHEGRLKTLAKAKLGEAERKAEERAVRQAYETLNHPARRAAFDAQLEGAAEREARGSRAVVMGIAASLVVALVVGLGWYFSERSARAERIRLEEARIARDAEERRYRAEVDQEEKGRRERESSAMRESAVLREESDRDRVERERAQYQVEVDKAKAAADEEAERVRLVREQKAADRELAEARDREKAESDLAAAQRDVERQKRYLADREREEQRIREERHQRAVRDSDEASKREARREREAREAELARQREERASRQQYYPPAVKR